MQLDKSTFTEPTLKNAERAVKYFDYCQHYPYEWVKIEDVYVYRAAIFMHQNTCVGNMPIQFDDANQLIRFIPKNQ